MFSILAPWFLVGLGALSVPLLVHLIHRDRKDAMPFPSLMFLEATPVHSVRRQKIRHWPLFLLRCLAIALLVLAFTRPFFSSRHHITSAIGPTGGRDIVIALDRSYSMGYGSRWTKAIAAAKDVVSHLHGNDRAAVVYFDGTATAATDLTSERKTLLAALDSVHPTAGVTRYDAALRLAQHIFGDTAQPRREVALVSDFQQSGWNGRNLPSLPAGTTLTPIDLADRATDNVAITHVDIHYDTSAARERVIVEARLMNRSLTPVRQRTVNLDVNDRRMQTRTVDLPANGATTVTFDPVITPPGLSRGIVTTGADSLEADNHFYFVVTHAPALPVLVVEPNDDKDGKGGIFLTHAFGIGDRLSFPTTVVRANNLAEHHFRGVSLVVLDGTPIPGGSVGRALTEYVRNGGGLLVALGAQSHPMSWPSLAHDLLPRPTRIVDRADDHGATLGFFDRGHPVFTLFGGTHGGDLTAARYLRYWTVTPDASDRELARFDDGHTALLERAVGAGRVLVWSSDLDGVWNDLPLQPIFLPLVQRTAQYVAGYTQERRWATVDEMVNLPSLFGEHTRRSDSTQSNTRSDAQYVAIAPSGTQYRFTKNDANMPASIELSESGFYMVTRSGGAGDSTQTVAANIDVSESDLTPLDTALLTTATAPTNTARTKAQHAATLMTSAELEHQQGVWWYLLALALVLLGAETLLSNRLSRATATSR